MSVAESALWGGIGALMVQGTQFVGMVTRLNDWPWRDGGLAGVARYAAVVVVSVVIAGLLAAASAETVQGRFGAAGIGAAAPLIIAGMARQERHSARE